MFQLSNPLLEALAAFMWVVQMTIMLLTPIGTMLLALVTCAFSYWLLRKPFRRSSGGARVLLLLGMIFLALFLFLLLLLIIFLIYQNAILSY